MQSLPRPLFFSRWGFAGFAVLYAERLDDRIFCG
jgi:hypothetical protein